MIWWILLILHAQNFWKWFIVPALIYLLERILRLRLVNKARYGKTFVKQGLVLPSNVRKMWLGYLGFHSKYYRQYIGFVYNIGLVYIYRSRISFLQLDSLQEREV